VVIWTDCPDFHSSGLIFLAVISIHLHFSLHSPVGDRFTGFFRLFLQNRELLDGDGDGERLLSSFRRMKTAVLAVFTSANPASVGKTIQSGDSSVVQIELNSETIRSP
jgi:hypothetical protein